MIKFINITIVLASISLLTQCDNTEYPSGKRYYNAYCGNCHMEDGKGLSKLIPSLEKSQYLINQQDKLPCIIRNGIKSMVADSSSELQLSMPANVKLSEIEILNICNYINNSWSNQQAQMSLQEIKVKLNFCD